ncbi:MAG: glutaminyl-peptide cyclotransferase [Bacteroidales bacterium]
MAFNPLQLNVHSILLTSAALLITSLSCARQQEKKTPRKNTAFTILSPNHNTRITNGDSLTISYTNPNDTNYDSVVAYINHTRLLKFSQRQSARVYIQVPKYGHSKLRLTAFNNGQAEQSTSNTLLILPKHTPQIYSYKIINNYPHDKHAYTQGLEVHGDTLYESTGTYGASSLRKVILKTGKVVHKIDLESKFFGEGICILNGLIYQLTWTEQSCLVYQQTTLDLQARLPYTGEGWGLTTDGQHLIMSNGSPTIKFLHPNNLSQHKSIEVCTPQGTVSQLNELEMVNDELWANIYTTDLIARIDTASGAVKSFINLKGILPNHLREAHTDVLNGIAYNKKTKQIFVTGKNWQRLYEIIVVPSKNK